jgi:type I restriction enzyme M protein
MFFLIVKLCQNPLVRSSNHRSRELGKGKEMVDRLSNLVSIFDNPALNFRDNRAEGDDILGDAYEYLMRHFATESGKSKGQFYTPADFTSIDFLVFWR